MNINYININYGFVSFISFLNCQLKKKIAQLCSAPDHNS